jgi:hypothetical protein
MRGFLNVRFLIIMNITYLLITVRYHNDGSKKLNARILLLSHMVFL